MFPPFTNQDIVSYKHALSEATTQIHIQPGTPATNLPQAKMLTQAQNIYICANTKPQWDFKPVLEAKSIVGLAELR